MSSAYNKKRNRMVKKRKSEDSSSHDAKRKIGEEDVVQNGVVAAGDVSSTSDKFGSAGRDVVSDGKRNTKSDQSKKPRTRSEGRDGVSRRLRARKDAPRSSREEENDEEDSANEDEDYEGDREDSEEDRKIPDRTDSKQTLGRSGADGKTDEGSDEDGDEDGDEDDDVSDDDKGQDEDQPPPDGETKGVASADDSKESKEDGEDEEFETASCTNAILTKTSFSSFKDRICDETLRGVSDMGFPYMTEIQEKAIPHLLEGRDLLAAAKTGSGKTLAFLIPAIELIHKLRFMPRNGTGALIISPTRELCMQIYGVLKEVMEHHYHTFGIIMGGTQRSSEVKKLAKGMNILVATPGRLLDHMQKTHEFLFKNLQCLIIDEADRILDIGFEEDMKQIVKLLPKKRQTMLFSATQTRKTEDLARISLKKEPIYVGVDDSKSVATVNGLEQGYVVCPSEKRFLLLFTFLKKNRHKKIMVFFSSCMSVKYHHELLNYIDLPVVSIHGRKKQAQRTGTFFQFCSAKEGILLCTDVAARGLDIPAVDWIIQFDPPDDPKEYIHRVGRTARGLHGKGHALLILRPEEVAFLRFLKHAKVPISEYEFSWLKIANIQMQMEKLVEKNYFLHMSAMEAYKGYVRSYDSHSQKQIFNVATLDLNMVAKSFGFRVPPSVDLIVPVGKRLNKGKGSKGHNIRQHSFKKFQKSKIFRHVETKRDVKEMKQIGAF